MHQEKQMRHVQKLTGICKQYRINKNGRLKRSEQVIMTYEYIDPEPYRRLLQLAANSKYPLLKASLEQAPAEIESLCIQVLAAMADPRRDILFELAHKMKGMAATLGAHRMMDLAAALMSLDAACATRAQAELREVCDKTREEITRLLQS
jgi:HPt (histidine-containing phosphotransfer) domain-containing protein